MHSFLSKARCLLLTILLLCAFGFNSYSTVDPVITRPLRGIVDSFHVNAESYVVDMKYFSLSQANKNAVRNNSILNMIGVGVDEQAGYYVRSNFSVSVVVEIKTYDQNESLTGTYNKTFTVNYDTSSGAKYRSFDYTTYSNAYAIRAKIVSIDSGSVSWPVSKVLKLENQLTATRDYTFNCSLALDGLAVGIVTDTKELALSWNPPSLNDNPGITEYDIEWTWVDEAVIDRYKDGNNYVQDLLFTNNATGVTISDSCNYFVPLLYDDQGRVFVRVRPVQITTTGQRIEGKWTWILNDAGQDLVSANPVNQIFAGHENDLNWQASTSFAEYGKRKSVVEYFDGSLRERQTVTKDNTTYTTIVAESFYDYQGKAMIHLLPAPTLNTAISYAKNFNQAIGYDEYPKSVFDKLETGSVCSSPAKPFNTDFGTANYYSAKNPMISADPAAKYIPDATANNPNEGYPFTETRMAPDGRIAAQSGVGISHQIGSGHETKYYYETPSQEELDALFGTDVGVASHYSKNIVKDVNGQYSVSYQDMHGRTIALALAGETPKNADGTPMLDQLDSKNDQVLIKELIDKETNIVTGNSIISSKPFVVVKDNSTYTFDYLLAPKQLSLLDCNNQPICYDCLYKLKFTVTSDCSNDLLYDDSLVNFTLGEYINQCNNGNANQGFQKHFSLTLNQGNYVVTKTLTLSHDAQLAYNDVFLQHDSCKKLIDFYNQELTILQATSNCAITCQSCKAAIGNDFTGFRAKFVAESGIPEPLSAEMVIQLQAAFNEAYANCDRMCNNNDGLDIIRSTREIMLQDVTPPYGQYAKLDDLSQTPPIYYQQKNYNIFKLNDPSNSLEGYGGSASSPDYLNPKKFSADDQALMASGSYYDELGNSESAAGMSAAEFAASFKTSWANQLLVHHPEFKKLQLSESALKPAYQFEATLNNDTTWAQAASHGFITNLIDLDPFFSTIGATYKSRMITGRYLGANQPPSNVVLNVDPVIHGILNYTLPHTSSPCANAPQYADAFVSMWQVALATVYCREKADGSPCSLDYSDLNTKAGCTMNPNYAQPQNNFNEGCATDRDWAWKLFKNLYLMERKKLIAAYLNTNAPVFPAGYPNTGTPPYQQRFINYANPQSIFTNLGIADAGNIGDIINAAHSDLQGATSQAQSLALQQYDTVCRGYANTWIAQLRTCPQLDAIFNNTATWQADSAWLVSRLVAICKNGADENHFLGSSSVKTGNHAIVNGHSYDEFPQVIQEFLQANGIANPTAECYDWVINTPKPYDKQVPLTEGYVLTKPSDCVCQRLHDLKNEWTLSGFAGTFSAYLQYKYGTFIDNQVLDALLGLCDGTYQCKMLAQPVVLPPALQCPSSYPAVASKTCINCSDYRAIKDDFYTAMNQHAPFVNPQDQNEINYNYAFAAFANHRTGFSKTWMEYVAFQNQCDSVNTAISCSSLDSTLNAFLVSPQYLANPVGTLCIEAFVTYFNSHYNVNYTYNQWMALFAACGHVPDVCQERITCDVFEDLVDGFYNQNGVQVFKNGNCQSLFVTYVNTQLGSNYTFAQLEAIYAYTCRNNCGLDVCSFPNHFLLKRVVRDFKLAYPHPWNLSDCQATFASYFNSYFGLPWPPDAPLYDFSGIKDNYFAPFVATGCAPDITNLCDPPYRCSDLQTILQNFVASHQPLDSLENCEDTFAYYFNHIMGTNYTYAQIASLYHNICGLDLNVCNVTTSCSEIIAFAASHPIQSISSALCHSEFLELFNEYFGTNYTSWEELVQLYQQCNYDLETVCRGCTLTVNCSDLSDFVKEFKDKNPDPGSQLGGNCEDYFTGLFNQQFGTQMTYGQISTYYLQQCSGILDVCTTNCDRYHNIIDGFNSQYASLKLPTAAREALFTFEFNRTFLAGADGQANQPIGQNADRLDATDIPPTTDPNAIQPLVGFQEIVNALDGCGIHDFNVNSSAIISIYDPQVLLSLKQVYYIIHPNGLPDHCQEDFQGWFNAMMQTQYVYAELYEIYNSVCGNNAGEICSSTSSDDATSFSSRPNIVVPPTLPPMLCGLNESGGGPVYVDDNPCKDLPKIAYHLAYERYQLYVDSLRNVFDTMYYNKCMAAKDLESFKVTYTTSEYHYTLFYYDQAGNLVKTIPPAGVQKLTNSQIATVQIYRANVLNGQPESNNKWQAQHRLQTEYRYNTLNEVVEQISPDGGISRFYYDRRGRLVVSQNSKQYAQNNYSYTLYDELGRIKELGQLNSGTPMTQAIAQNTGDASDPSSLAHWLFGKNAEQIARTFYDNSYLNGSATLCPQYMCQTNLRNRVSYSATYLTSTPGGTTEHHTATFYNYDIHGNVCELLQDYNFGTAKNVGNRFVKIGYTYDLISGKVNTVSYQAGLADAFYHRYSYDAENRLVQVETSKDKIVWEKDARYSYYKNRPLARTLVGELQVQGLDYAYTLEGWLSGVNSTSVGDGTFDIGKDGKTGSANAFVARDAFGFSLNYFSGAYKPIGGNNANAFITNPFDLTNTDANKVANSLFNGNITSMVVNIPKLGAASVYGYRYDQLNRIVGMDLFGGMDNATNSFTAVASSNYKERVSYDANGNIKTYFRNATTQGGTPLGMDNFTYQYEKDNGGQLSSNRLRYVHDQVSDNNYSEDIDSQTPLTLAQVQVDYASSQSTDNYQYDNIGNLVQDTKGGISLIEWNIYGKITHIHKTNGTDVNYEYDAAGNRITKIVTANGVTKETWYVRDVAGNVMSVYSKDPGINGNSFSQTELDIYGSNRLGIYNRVTTIPGSTITNFERGWKAYEGTNHLGNVLVTFNDKKIQHSSDGINIDYYTADLLAANDYYPFGMSMPGRKFAQGNSYRYGFNGKENDEDLGIGDQDYGMRVYDTRLGKFLSVDPLSEKYPWLTPYQFAGNTPIQAIDVDGEEGGLPAKENKVVNLFISPDIITILNPADNWQGIAMGPGLVQAMKYNNIPSSNLVSISAASSSDVYNYINELKSQGYIIGNIIIDSHGEEGTSIQIGNEKFTTGTEPALTRITSQATGSVIVMGCQMGNNTTVLSNISASMESSSDKTVIASQGWTTDWWFVTWGFLNDKNDKENIKRSVTFLWDHSKEFRDAVKASTPGIVRWLFGKKAYIRILTRRIMKEGISPSGSADSFLKDSYNPNDPTHGPIYAKNGKWYKVGPKGRKLIKGNFYLDSNGNWHNFKKRTFYQTVWGKIYKTLTEKKQKEKVKTE